MSHFLGAKLFLSIGEVKTVLKGKFYSLIGITCDFTTQSNMIQDFSETKCMPSAHNSNTVYQNKTPNTDAALSMRLEIYEFYSKYSQSCSKNKKIPNIIETKNIIICTPCRNHPDCCLFYIFGFYLRRGCTVHERSYGPKGFRKENSEEHWCKVGLPILSLPVHTFNCQFLLFIGSLSRIKKKKACNFLIMCICLIVSGFLLGHF
jgi:hypothetical protein